jgi:enoyl-CoA hydratase/carnithine racemase
VGAEEFDAAVAEWAATLAAKPPRLLRLGKDALFAQQDMALRDALAYAQAQLVLGQTSQDAHEGISAFLERREPQWKGR